MQNRSANANGRTSMKGLFSWRNDVSQQDVSALDTTGVTDMREMFFGCRKLKRLDLSAFDFSSVEHLDKMFGECWDLEEVILSDTILCAGNVPHYVGPYTQEQLNEISRQEYIARGPELASMTVDSIIARDEVPVPFHKATEGEARHHLGLFSPRQKLTIVPHRAR